MVVDVEGGCFAAFCQFGNGPLHGSEEEHGGDGHHHGEEHRRPLYEEVQGRIGQNRIDELSEDFFRRVPHGSTSSPVRYAYFLHYKVASLNGRRDTFSRLAAFRKGTAEEKDYSFCFIIYGKEKPSFSVSFYKTI